MQPKSIAIVLLAALVLAAPASALPPKAEESDDKIVLENDHVTVWFQGKKPMLKVIPARGAEAGENASGAYAYKFTEVVEYRDLDGDGAPSNNEVLASLALDRASQWVVNRTQSADAVHLNLTLAAHVKMGPKTDGVPIPQNVNLSLPDRVAEVSLNFTIRDGAFTVQSGGANVTVPVTAVKYDFAVARWPFVDAQRGSRLALVMHVEGALELDEGAEGVESATVAANQTRVGALSWTTVAEGVAAEGAVEVPVKTKALSEGNLTRLVHTYDAPGLSSLLHDPTIGVAPAGDGLQETGDAGGSAPGGNQVPGSAAALALAGLAATALALRRRGA